MTDNSPKIPFRILGLDHLGIASKSHSETLQFFRDILGVTEVGQEVVDEQKVEVTMFMCGSDQTKIELLKSSTPDSPIAGFLSKKGGGVHHIAIRVDNLEAALSHLAASGVKLIDRYARTGADNKKIAFVHPSSTGGLLIELTQ